MDVTPTPPQTQPTRGKSGAAKTTAIAPPKSTAKPVRRKATAEQPEPETLATTTLSTGPEEVGGDVGQLIATTAYYLAAARNFEPGHELEDWLEAERQVRPEA